MFDCGFFWKEVHWIELNDVPEYELFYASQFFSGDMQCTSKWVGANESD